MRKYDHLNKRKLLVWGVLDVLSSDCFWCKIDRVWFSVKRSTSKRQVRRKKICLSNVHTVL